LGLHNGQSKAKAQQRQG